MIERLASDYRAVADIAEDVTYAGFEVAYYAPAGKWFYTADSQYCFEHKAFDCTIVDNRGREFQGSRMTACQIFDVLKQALGPTEAHRLAPYVH
jgi:hypothetical protein